MPTPPSKQRTYCKTCQDFTIHNWENKDDLLCSICGTKDSGYNFDEINQSLVDAQRKRYTKQKQEELFGLYGAFMKGVGLNALKQDFEKAKVVECDAGQKQIDEKRKKQKLLLQQKETEKYQLYLDNFKHLNRNDKCRCGSNKKYKQCCLPKFLKY